MSNGRLFAWSGRQEMPGRCLWRCSKAGEEKTLLSSGDRMDWEGRVEDCSTSRARLCLWELTLLNTHKG